MSEGSKCVDLFKGVTCKCQGLGNFKKHKFLLLPVNISL